MATDLAMGQPMEYAMVTCVVAVRLGERAGLGLQELQDAYYEALLRYIGCNADVAWLPSIVGDEIALRREFARIDSAEMARQRSGFRFRTSMWRGCAGQAGCMTSGAAA